MCVSLLAHVISPSHVLEHFMLLTGETPLHLAARFGRLDAARSLLEAGADPNAQDVTGRTPLDTGVAADAVDVVMVAAFVRAGNCDNCI